MTHLIRVETPEEADWCGAADELPPFDSRDIARHEVDTHYLLTCGDRITARCSLWWRVAPPIGSHRVGVIGHFAACDGEAARRLLDHASHQLAEQGCTLALGPMDGSTWRRYRLVTERGTGEPPFFLEPDNPDDWPDYFRAAGFTSLAEYHSAVNENLSVRDPRAERIAARLARQGVEVRAANAASLEKEMRRIYAVATASFRANLLYTPLSENAFLDLYRPILSMVRPETVLLSEREGQPVGFLFAVPDMLEARHGERVRTLILKTVAVLPDRAFAGLGALLVDRCHAVAAGLGYTRVIHALMHGANASGNISRRTARIFRRYALFARALSP